MISHRQSPKVRQSFREAETLRARTYVPDALRRTAAEPNARPFELPDNGSAAANGKNFTGLLHLYLSGLHMGYSATNATQ